MVDRGPAPPTPEAEAPAFGQHVHLAYGVFVCDGYLAPLADRQGDRVGIQTHEDGLIHVHPTAAEATGEGAVLGLFAREVGLVLDDGALTLPGGGRYEHGDDCAGQPGSLRVLTWDGPDDPSPDVHRQALEQVPVRAERSSIAIVFAPDDADVPVPPWSASLVDPNAAQQGRPPLTV